MKTGAFDEPELAPPGIVLVEHVGAGDVRRHQVGRELNPLELHIENLSDRRDHQRLRQTGNTNQQAMPAGENRREDLLDDVGLSHDDLVQFLDHDFAVLAELVEELVEVGLLVGQGAVLSNRSKARGRSQTGRQSKPSRAGWKGTVRRPPVLSAFPGRRNARTSSSRERG